MEIAELMKQRHSVRQYTDTPIEEEKREILDALIAQINQEAGLHIQIFYEEPKCFSSFLAHYGKFTGVKNYIALVGKKASDLEEKLGYYGEKLVLKAQELGLNTCWVALTHGKSAVQLGKNEKLVCLLSLGYGITQGEAHKSRQLDQICQASSAMPEWFLQGMEAVLLAPTAMNQQKFFFTLLPDGTVKATAGRGFYTHVDLGIAAFHFEAVTGKKIDIR